MAKNNLQFVAISANFNQQASIRWVDVVTQCRYHIWVRVPSLEPIVKCPGYKNAGQIDLMKNPPEGTPYNGEGYFDTRHLNGSLPQHKKMIDETIAYIKANGLLEKAIQKEKEDQTNRDDENKRRYELQFANDLREFSQRFLNEEQREFLWSLSEDDILERLKQDMKEFASPKS